MPSWQFLLVDLRCHGQTNTESMESGERRSGKDSVKARGRCYRDVTVAKGLPAHVGWALVRREGGDVYGASVFARQRNKVLPRPVQVWVLDTVPGDAWARTGDHPKIPLTFVRTLDTPFASRETSCGCVNWSRVYHRRRTVDDDEFKAREKW